MIDVWKRDRAKMDKEMAALRGYLETHPNKDMYQPGRVKLRKLLNEVALQRMAVHQKIRRYEEDERLTEIVKNISGLSETEAASLMRDMERFKLVNV